MNSIYFVLELDQNLQIKLKNILEKNVNNYLNFKHKSKLIFTLVDETVVENVVKELNSKLSCGKDGISTILLKKI